MATAPLSMEQIQGIMGKRRGRGTYGGFIKELIESGELGREVDFESGPFAGKNPQSARQSFATALNGKNAPEGSENIALILDSEGEGDDKTYRLFVVNEAAYNAARGNSSGDVEDES